MGRKTCENVDSKRELLYSFSTLVFTPVLHYFAVTSAFSSLTWDNSPVDEGTGTGSATTNEGDESRDGYSTLPVSESGATPEDKVLNGSRADNDLVISFILQRRELPFETVAYIVLFEVLKLLVVFTVFPGSHLFDQTPGLCSMWNLSNFGGGGGIGSSAGGSGGKYSQGRLPFSKRDRDNGVAKSPNFQVKFFEIWKGLCNYVVGCVACHVFVVLLGASVIENFKVTLQFCVILTTWLLSPMCLAVQPSRLLQEIMFISLWNSDNEVLYRTKWRFATMVFGAWAGAVVIPLDWDRPWQKWPIPCLTSTLLTFLVSNLVMTIHLFCTNFGVYHKMSLISTESNKIKNF